MDLQASNCKIRNRDGLQIRLTGCQPADSEAANGQRAYRKCTNCQAPSLGHWPLLRRCQLRSVESVLYGSW